MESEMQKIESPEQLAALVSRYPIVGSIVTSENSVTIEGHDRAGNRVIVTMQAGEKGQYQEIPAQSIGVDNG